MENTSARLKKLMDMRGIRQADILEMIKPYCDRYGVKIPRNAISQYVTGKVVPKQDKLTILGLALDVAEAWLMGYDVPMERNPIYTTESLTPEESRLLTAFRGADERARQDAIITLEAHQTASEKKSI